MLLVQRTGVRPIFLLVQLSGWWTGMWTIAATVYGRDDMQSTQVGIGCGSVEKSSHSGGRSAAHKDPS